MMTSFLKPSPNGPTLGFVNAPPVFADMTQEALDLAYDQDHWAANAAEVQGRIVARSYQVARAMPPQTRRYGASERQLVDIFAPADARGAPVFILVHGGAWLLSMREAFYGPAPAIMAAGCILVVVGFDCLPAVSMVRMVEQIGQAVLWVAAEIDAFGGNGRNVNLIGHSSGAHLAAAALTSDLGAATPNMRQATLISGIYDLAPVMLSSRRHYIDLTDPQAAALSPIRHVDAFAGTASVWWGADESPEFKRQSQSFANALQMNSRLDQATVISGRNHFEMLEELDNPSSPIVEAMLSAAHR